MMDLCSYYNEYRQWWIMNRRAIRADSIERYRLKPRHLKNYSLDVDFNKYNLVQGKIVANEPMPSEPCDLNIHKIYADLPVTEDMKNMRESLDI